MSQPEIALDDVETFLSLSSIYVAQLSVSDVRPPRAESSLVKLARRLAPEGVDDLDAVKLASRRVLEFMKRGGSD